MFTNLRDSNAVSENAYLFQCDSAACCHRRGEARTFLVLNADNFCLWTDILNVSSDTGNESAATDRNEDRIDRAAVLMEDFHRDGTLTCDNFWVVEWVNKMQAALFLEHQCASQCLIEGVPEKHDFRSA